MYSFRPEPTNQAGRQAKKWMHCLVLAPLDGVEVDALLNKLPQGAELAQEADALADGLEHVVDLGVGGEAADAEPDAAVCALVTVAERPQDVARLQRGRRAGAARRQRDVLERHQKRLALYVRERYVHASRVEMVRVAVLGCVLHGEKTLQQTVG